MDVEDDEKTPVYVEAQARLDSRADRGELLERVQNFVATSLAAYRDGPVDFSSDEVLARELEALSISDISLRSKASVSRQNEIASSQKTSSCSCPCIKCLARVPCCQPGPTEIDSCLIRNTQTPASAVPAWQAALQIRLYQCSDEGMCEETEGDTNSCNIWMLPAKEFSGLWETVLPLQISSYFPYRFQPH